MKASLTNLAAAGLICAAGLPVFGATSAAAGLRPHVFVHAAVSASRSGERHATREGRRRARRGYPGELDFLGAVGPSEGEPPAAEEEAPPQAANSCPPATEHRRVAANVGPRIVEIGARAPAARRGRWPVVVYGDFSP